jgi:serine/threonine-protein kinase
MKTAGLILGAGGVLGVAIGSYFGLRAGNKDDESKKFCPEKNLCTERGVQLRDDAKSAAAISTITFGLGTALLATGAVLYLTADDDAAAAGGGLEVGAGVSPGEATVTFGGVF